VNIASRLGIARVLGYETGVRIRAIDWLRGLVIALMTVDHAGSIFDAAHLHGDTAARWTPGTPLPAGEFLTRWITHLCAPVFVLVAGASLALSTERRRDEPGQTRFIVTRGLLIAALDPLWMGLGFSGYARLPLQVLYAIGLSLVCMAALRRLPTRVLLAGAIAIQGGGELVAGALPADGTAGTLATLLLVGGPVTERMRCSYPLLPWLSIMMVGWVLGRWMLELRAAPERARSLALLGGALLVGFLAVRGVDGYGNWHLHRDSLVPLQWLHVSKYPPSVTFTLLELGLGLLLLATFVLLDDPARPRTGLAALSLFGGTAFFYYLLHVHLLALAQLVLGLDRSRAGLAKTWLAAAAALALLAGPCWLYRRYKAAHPAGFARYI
jgi:uncharacterized membrane protein